jgi:hypothetical protein
MPNPHGGAPFGAKQKRASTNAVTPVIDTAALFFLGFDTVTNLTALTVFTFRVGNFSSSLFGE